MSNLQWDHKDPNEVLDYQIDWTKRLSASETISTSSWTIVGDDSALVQNSDAISGVYTIVWLSAGTAGKKYTLTNRIVTNQGRTMDQSVVLRVKEK
jgi:hypothetical protein